MSTKVIELRPNRSLLNEIFNGYKLSLEPTPILKNLIKVPPAIFATSEKQYSSLHARYFGLQNHLVKDPWNACNSYFIDQNNTIQKVEYEAEVGRLRELQQVFEIPRHDNTQDRYNFNLVFVAEDKCLVSDGCGWLFLLGTGQRAVKDEWSLLYEERIFEKEGGGFLIEDARIDSFGRLMFLLVRVQQGESKFYSVLDWMTYQLSDGVKFLSHRRLKGSGYVCYAAIDIHNQILNCISDKPFVFIKDDENPVGVEPNGTTERTIKDDSSFTWAQDDNEIFVTFNTIEPGDLESDFRAEFTGNRIKVEYKATRVLIDAELFGDIQSDLVATSFRNERFWLKMPKAEHDCISWPYLIVDGPPETVEITEKAIIQPPPPPTISTLDSEMEECDFSISGDETEYNFERLDSRSHSVTHRIHLGSIPPLFTISIDPNQLPAVALRYDVDAIICSVPQSLSEDWNLQHHATLNAFGYVQASKQQKKYMSCSPDFSQAVICEAQRHFFLYKGQYDSASGLRNRNGPKPSIGQQKLIQLDDETTEILGIVVENDFTLLLTEKCLICLQTRIN